MSTSNNLFKWIQNHQLTTIVLGGIVFLGVSRFSSAVHDDCYQPLFQKHIRRIIIKEEDKDSEKYKIKRIATSFFWSLFELLLLIFIIYLVATYIFKVDNSLIMLQSPLNITNNGDINNDNLKSRDVAANKLYSNHLRWSSTI